MRPKAPRLDGGPPRPKVPKTKRKPTGKDSAYLNAIRRLPCLLSGRPAEAAHVRYADALHGKELTGMGRKPEDKWALPLCPELHRMLNGCQHSGNEREWWQQFKIDPLEVCKQLWNKDLIHMERTIIKRQPWDPAIKAKIAAILKGTKQ